MKKVDTNLIPLGTYTGIVPDRQLIEAIEIAAKLKGLHIVHINATPVGGGVAEILKSLVPLMQDVGIDAEWYAIEPDDLFFRVTKTLHHCLQGKSSYLADEEIELYLTYNERAAQALVDQAVSADLWIVHDVQVLPLLQYLKTTSPGIWVCHIDTTEPNDIIRQLLLPHIKEYQKVLFNLPEYHLDGLDPARVSIFPPAIDPLSPKNIALPREQARAKLARLGVDPARPLVSQVSRFDRWKDPWGVIDAYRLAKKRIPALQLALVGAMIANDDADAIEVFDSVRRHVAGDPDIYLFSDPAVISSIEVNAFQSGSDVVVQKSVREGFGLTVAEAMWKGTPVVGGDCGGIRLQIRDSETGFLVSDTSSCADRIVTLLKDPALAQSIGEAGRESVRGNYLMPRLLRDYLHLILTMVETKEPSLAVAA